jgi:hypothetical protein
MGRRPMLEGAPKAGDGREKRRSRRMSLRSGGHRGGPVGQGSKASAKKGRVDGAFREANGDDEFWGTEDGGGHDM